MNKNELTAFLRSQSGWSHGNELSKLSYWGELLNAALDLGEEDYECGENAKYPSELNRFLFALGMFIEANVSDYTTPSTTLTGSEQ